MISFFNKQDWSDRWEAYVEEDYEAINGMERYIQRVKRRWR
jgi:hypothetical protein